MKIKKYFLIFASLMVSFIALAYGVSPTWFAHTFLGVDQLDLNLAHILRAVMGLYIALAIFWFISAFSEKNRNIAVLTTLIFAAGLVSGRLLSVVEEGIPSALLSFYIVAELALVPVAYWVYKVPE